METSTLPECKLLSTEWRALERGALLSRIIWILPSINSCFELRITERLICLINVCHLFLCIVTRDALCCSLIGVELDDKLAVCSLDVSFVGITRDAEYLIIVLLFRSAKQSLGFLQHILYS